MPARPPKSKKEKAPADQEAIPDQEKTKAKEVNPKLKAQKIDQSGLTSRVKGHVSARVKRSQGKRDSKS